MSRPRRSLIAGGVVLLVAIGAVGATLWFRRAEPLAKFRGGRYAEFQQDALPADLPVLVDLGGAPKAKGLPRFLAIDRPASGVRVLVAIDTHSGCRLALVRDLTQDQRQLAGNPAALDRATFVDDCHGGLYARDGTVVGGAVTLGLSGVPASVEADGRVTADLTRTTPGTPRPSSPRP